MIIDELYRRLPAGIRYNLRAMVGANGHGRSWLDGVKARRDALGKRALHLRLDSLAAALTMAGWENFDGKVCLDFGAGYVPSDALAMYILGARSVVSLDYNAIASERYTRLVLENVADDFVQSRFGSEALHRLRKLRDASPGGFQSLSQQGFRYVAPCNYATSPLADQFDFIYSTNVFEHIHITDITPILRNLANSLGRGGFMYHLIHLEDHLDFYNAPFEFLSAATAYDPARDYDRRGNRLRASDWENIANGLGSLHWTARPLYQSRSDVRPERLLPMFDNMSRDDLFASHVELTTRR